MGTAKTEEFTRREAKLARYAKALSHPARIAILRFLIKKNSCICGDIVNELPLSQSTVSQHLKELKDAGLIKGDIAGVKVCYCIDHAAWAEARKSFEELFYFMEKNNKTCC
jgi:predicted transcriptional regulator